MNIAIIPARGGSKEILGKNLKPLNSKPLIAYSIESAKNSKCVDRVIVSTDDEKIAYTSEKYGAEVIIRPPELATDVSPSEDALIHVVDTIERDPNVRVDFILFLQATNPIRQYGLIDQCFDKLLKKKGDSLVTVCFDHIFIGRKKKV